VTVRFSNVDLLRVTAPNGWGWKRHLSSVALLLTALALTTAMARPSVNARMPLQRATIVLAIDVSLSMQATDVAPTRIAAAQAAAKIFVAELPASYNLGLVSFCQTATVLVPPAKDHAKVTAAIDQLQLCSATATGEAVFMSLKSIAAVPPDGTSGSPPARILLLSDGYRTYGRTIEEAAHAASAANVPVSTIAFGTAGGTVDIGGQTSPVPVDRQALSTLAELTRGRYYEAASGDALRHVYQDLGASIGYHTVPREVWPLCVAAGFLFALTTAALGLLWTTRIP
jgi:Ca-activated chloride channel family protein